MQIQARLYFTSDDVTCVPVDPALSQYEDRIGFEDPTFGFRMRLFSARVSKSSLTACVALVLPSDLVTRSEGQGVPGLSDAPILPVMQGADEALALIVPAGTPDRPFQLCVDRSTVDDVIEFARQHGVYPAILEVPTLEGGETIALPIHNEAPPPAVRAFGQAQANADSPRAEIPPAVLRELEKRKQQEARNAARNARPAASDVRPAESAKEEAAAMALASRITATFAETVEPVARHLRGLAAPLAQDARPSDAGPALADEVATPNAPSTLAAMPQDVLGDQPRMSDVEDPFVTIRSAGQPVPRHDAQPPVMAPSVVPVLCVRPHRDMGPMIARSMDRLRQASLVPVQAAAGAAVAAAGGVRGAWLRTTSALSVLLVRVRTRALGGARSLRRMLQPALDAASVILLRPMVGAAAVIGIVTTGAVALVLPLFVPGQAEIRFSDAAPVVAAPVQEATPDRAPATGTSTVTSAIPSHVPVAVAVARAQPTVAPLTQPASQAGIETETTTPLDLGPVMLTQSASVEHNPQPRAVPAPSRLVLRPGSASVQTSAPVPVVPDAAPRAMLPPQALAQGEAEIAGVLSIASVSSRVDATPGMAAVALLSAPEIDEDLPARLVDTDTALPQRAVAAPPVPQPAAPAVAAVGSPAQPAVRLDPTPVADPARPVLPAQARVVPQPDTLPQAVVLSLGPERAPRPLQRPAVAAPARVVAAAAVTPAPTTPPAARPVASPTAAATQDVAPAAAVPTLEILPRSPSNPFRVLAIVGTGAQGTALVRTGPNQTTVLEAGTTTALGRVVDVRREGIVFVQDGRMRLLPIGQ